MSWRRTTLTKFVHQILQIELFFISDSMKIYLGDSSRHGSFSGPSNTRQLTLYRNDDQDPYGFGLRVVGQQLQGEQPNQAQLQLCARVLWISPAGPAQRAGVKVGDKVIKDSFYKEVLNKVLKSIEFKIVSSLGNTKLLRFFL